MKTLVMILGMSAALFLGSVEQASARPNCGTIGYYDVSCKLIYSGSFIKYCGFTLKECIAFKCPTNYIKPTSACRIPNGELYSADVVEDQALDLEAEVDFADGE